MKGGSSDWFFTIDHLLMVSHALFLVIPATHPIGHLVASWSCVVVFIYYQVMAWTDLQGDLFSYWHIWCQQGLQSWTTSFVTCFYLAVSLQGHSLPLDAGLIIFKLGFDEAWVVFKLNQVPHEIKSKVLLAYDPPWFSSSLGSVQFVLSTLALAYCLNISPNFV